MDKRLKYRKLIKNVLANHAEGVQPNASEYESQLLLDDENGHYMLLGVGWVGSKRVHGCLLHLDLKGDKIWIQQDGTDGVAFELENLGVPKKDMVLGFYAPYRRADTEYAAA